ncbi:MAG: DUF4111 domain-containing protein [Gemmatimonadota bacterium]|nr:DUF4111 domain-containing protein [Gemmatimonadota bacterium]
MKFNQLPPTVMEVCQAFVDGLEAILDVNLHGIYMHGASVFSDSGPIQDIDCHVILAGPLSSRNKDAILQLQRDIAGRFPPLGGELDAYFIRYEDALKTGPPAHQLQSGIRDEAWALHCAHVRGGRYITLYGPPPADTFPAHSWDAISAALEHELAFIEQNLQYPDYCVLNMCRIMFSVQERNVVVSKFSSGKWASDRFPVWKPLIDAAVASYLGTKTHDEAELLKNQAAAFIEFGKRRIREELQRA